MHVICSRYMAYHLSNSNFLNWAFTILMTNLVVIIFNYTSFALRWNMFMHCHIYKVRLEISFLDFKFILISFQIKKFPILKYFLSIPVKSLLKFAQLYRCTCVLISETWFLFNFIRKLYYKMILTLFYLKKVLQFYQKKSSTIYANYFNFFLKKIIIYYF